MSDPLFNPNAGPNGRTGGPYLDEEELKAHEEYRAKREGREPDYNNMVSSPGVKLVSAEEVITRHHVQPSQHDKPLADATAMRNGLGAAPVGTSGIQEEVTENPTTKEKFSFDV